MKGTYHLSFHEGSWYLLLLIGQNLGHMALARWEAGECLSSG